MTERFADNTRETRRVKNTRIVLAGLIEQQPHTPFSPTVSEARSTMRFVPLDGQVEELPRPLFVMQPDGSFGYTEHMDVPADPVPPHPERHTSPNFYL